MITVVALAAGAASKGGATASHRAATPASRNATFPSWSPDGKQILFGYGGRIVRVSSRSGGPLRTAHAGSFDPLFWAPGGQIVFRGSGDSINWYSVLVQGGKAKPIPFPSCGTAPGLQCWPDSCLACSPDTFAILTPHRDYAAVTTDFGAGNPPPPESIALLKLKPGHAPVEISTPLNAEERSGAVSDSILSFSPHGRQLIFRRDGGTGPTGLMAFRLGGGAPVPLAQSGLRGATLLPSDAQRVQWSPDGRWVAFVENESLEVVPTTGTNAPRVLPPCPDFGDFLSGFAWSPTSALIAYDCLSNLALDRGNLLTVRPDGTHLTDLLSDRPLRYVNRLFGLPEPAQWSPDGSRLVFVAHRVGQQATHVWTVRPNGHDLIRRG
ncbi:MAG TPA: hypothetical protein VF094_01395 [Gaiellaceae bacterium]|nr:hypothetical protein [Gaiellaceae bacterium]